MKKKLKLILFLVLIGGIGILLILGTWLYGSYNQRQELFLATAEHTLFNAIQETVQQRQKADTLTDVDGIRRPTSRLETQLVTKIVQKFPNVPLDYLNTLLDSLYHNEIKSVPAFRKLPEIRVQRLNSTNGVDRPRMLLPFFLFLRDSLDQQALDQIRIKFQKDLIAKGINTKYDFKVVIRSEDSTLRGGSSSSFMRHRIPSHRDIAAADFSIRPVLIDPDKSKFITVDFRNPWQFVLYSLSWQLMISVVLVGTIMGSFVYLFHTLLKQNKLDTLRKAFVNNLTHELRTPVTTVSVALQALEGSVGNMRERDSYHSIAREELNHLSSMIDKVLQIAEDDLLIDRQLACKEYDMVALIHKCVANAQLSGMQNGVNIVFKPSIESEMIFGDPDHMKNVIGNLMENAIKYGSTEVNVFLDGKKDSRYLSLSIQDNGIGISSAYHLQVFEPFFRVPQGNLYPVKGFGLGLAYVRQIVRQHGGDIKVKSVLNEGSTFILTIPKNMKR
ncbi:HAMP domain-containing histidine kinase [Sphingobacterium alkalisoli]|uniref:histidine kinase n=1 Tax=Sphingobacterium alkalisoli TaxID=1874115 RepID=A0A4U0H2D1_9SPHI|nr:HAMP domain-containing sensor histidine kinase [Sphingobacterium alkalisoli]TJY65765.1 HAMP domain-containing histidine kinase [Sphingobacterium alkalisoli]GGH18444.1 sensor protein RprX [Sphingobacterium alkalisoli]